MRVLFVTRKFPPDLGGMETFSHGLFASLEKISEVRFLGGSYRWWALPSLAASVAYGSFVDMRPWFKQSEPVIVHFADAALAPLVSVFSRYANTRTVVTAHGLDVAYRAPFYRALISAPLRAIDGVACDSEFTSRICLALGVRPRRARVIPLAVDASLYTPLMRGEARDWLEQLDLSVLATRTVLLTVGRLVPRKGVRWFVENVMPALTARIPGVFYCVVGDGKDMTAIRRAVIRLGLSSHTAILGTQSVDVIRAIAAWATLFVAPNVQCDGDPEGFGLVTLEARALGLPVLAAEVDGLGESILHERDGLLVPAGDAEAFVSAIERIAMKRNLLLSSNEIRERVMREFNWDTVAASYLRFYQNVVQASV